MTRDARESGSGDRAGRSVDTLGAARAIRGYVCTCCGERFESAQAEDLAEHGQIPEGDRAVICDGCYEQFMTWNQGRHR